VNIILDYDICFTPEVIRRLVDVGIRAVYVFDYWHRHEPAPGRYDFDEIVRYAEICRSVGIKMLLQTPIGSPFWMDESFYLYNKSGQNCCFSEYFCSGSQPDWKLSNDREVCANRIPAYWHKEAEEHTANYIQALRCAIESLGATCIPNIGAHGEYMFPANFWFNANRTPSPWWFDEEARRLWKDRDPVKWFREERSRIIARRLTYYRESWTQFVPYYDSWDNWQLGNMEISGELEKHALSLKTILFTVFYGEDFPVMAEQQARRIPTWGGAEGCANIVVNTQRAIDMGLKGTLCRLIGPGTDEPTIPDWKYEVLKTANGLFSEDDGKYFGLD